jgi:type I restriction enzyme M protein
MFYTVTLPCTLWFLDKGKASLPSPASGIPKGRGFIRGAGGEGVVPDRANTVLFIDARHLYRQVDRAHRDWTPAQIGFIANIVRLYRGEALDFTQGGAEAETKIKAVFSPPPQAGEGSGERGLRYADIPGLCKAATLAEIEAQGWSLNPGRYVGVAPGEAVSDEDFKEQIEELNEELETLNAQALELQDRIAQNVASLLT